MRVPSTAASFLAKLLLVCVVVEFVSLRVLLRSGPALSGSGQSRSLADMVVVAGHTAMNFGVVVAVALLGVLGWRLYSLASLPWRACAVATAILAATVTAVLILGMASPAWMAITAGVAAVVVLLALVAPRLSPRHAIALGLFGAAYGAILGHYALQALSGRGSVPVYSLNVYYLGETLVVLAAAGTLLLIPGPWSWKRVLAGVALGGGFLAARSATPWLISTIGIWNFGVTMSLPALFYGVALVCYATSVLHVWKAERMTAVALLLMALGGMKLDVIYFLLLAVTGFLMLVTVVAARRDDAVERDLVRVQVHMEPVDSTQRSVA